MCEPREFSFEELVPGIVYCVHRRSSDWRLASGFTVCITPDLDILLWRARGQERIPMSDWEENPKTTNFTCVVSPIRYYDPEADKQVDLFFRWENKDAWEDPKAPWAKQADMLRKYFSDHIMFQS